MKKLGLLLATVIMIMLFTVSASALEATGQCGDNVYWEFDETAGELIISGSGAMYDYSHYQSPFCSSRVKNVIIQKGVTTIGDRTFLGCNNLKNIVIPDSVIYIRDYAFFGCENLSNVTIPDGVISIGNQAFQDCDGLMSITIPDSVTSMASNTFNYCDSLTSIIVDENNKYYSNDSNGVLFNKDKTELIKYPEGIISATYKIPDSVTCIDEWAFSGCKNITSIKIPEGVISIWQLAFEGCTGLTSITIPDSVTIICYNTFSGCTSLTSIIVDKNNECYSNDSNGVLFNKVKSELIKYPEGNTRTTYIIPDSVTTIGVSAFLGCDSLTSITIPDSVTTIDFGAFYCDNLKHVGFKGTKEQWNNIEIDISNSAITNPKYLHLNFNPEKDITEKTTDATCTKDGTKTESCSCGYIYHSETIPLLGHDLGYFVLAKESTCTEKGEERAECSRCDYSETKEIKALGHDIGAYVVAKEPTCTEKGEERAYCLRCDYYKAKSIKALGHNLGDYTLVKESTCTEKGEERAECSRCDYFETKEIKALGHNVGDFIVVKAATCTEKGEERAYCSRCDYYKTKSIKALGHNMGDYVLVKESTCSEKGEEKAACSRCDYIKTKTIALKKHIDANGDENCDVCEFYLPSLSCLCVCHAKTIGAFLYKLFTILDEIFDIGLLEKVFHITSDYCDCGLQH